MHGSWMLCLVFTYMSQRRGFHHHLGRLISIRLLIVQCDVYMVPSSLLVFTCIYLVLTRQPGALTWGSQPSRRDATWCSPARDACVQFFFKFYFRDDLPARKCRNWRKLHLSGARICANRPLRYVRIVNRGTPSYVPCWLKCLFFVFFSHW